MSWIGKCFLTAFVLLNVCANAQSEQLTVVYPDVSPPYNTIFEQIIQGISTEFNGELIHLKLPEEYDATQSAKSITTEKVIALGQRGMHIAEQIYKDKFVVVGALPLTPNAISGVSLMAAPDVLFDSLKKLAPQITTVTVLYTSSSTWIIDIAKKEAAARNLKFNAKEVTDIRAAVEAYSEIFKGSNLENTAIWLPIDPVTANDKVIVPVILEKAWENKMVVFSSKPNHAKRGALFSAMPNNELLGTQLVRLLNSISQTPNSSMVNPLEHAKLAVNLRTAAHLGYIYSSTERANFALVFPK